MVDFTGGTWRSLIDGSEVSAIPDPEVYLHDDWGDNKLTDRDDSGTTTHNGVEGVYRPEWTVDAGEPVAQNDQLEIREGDALYADININLDEPLTVEWDANNLPDGSGGDQIFLAVWSESLTFRDTDLQEYQESYIVRVRGEGNISFRVVDGDGNSSELISGSHSGADDNIKVTRDADANWELFVNDESQGTATDDTFTDPQYASFAARDSVSPEADINEVKWS